MKYVLKLKHDDIYYIDGDETNWCSSTYEISKATVFNSYLEAVAMKDHRYKYGYKYILVPIGRENESKYLR